MDANLLRPLPLRQQGKVWDEILTERLETVMPRALESANADMWVIITCESNEDPLTRSLLPSDLFDPRGKMFFVFVRTPEGVRRLSLSRPAGIEHLYENPWYGIGPGTDWKGHIIVPPTTTQWECLRQIVEQYDPARIAINMDEEVTYANGLRATDERQLRAALGEKYAARLVSSADAVVTWLSVRVPREAQMLYNAVRISHSIINDAFTSGLIIPYVTTNEDVRYYMMQRLYDMGLVPSFEASVAVFRHGLPGMHNNPITIEPGDVVHCDFGLKYMNLCTDAQELGYVLRPGETEVPAGLLEALRVTNRLQDIVRSNMRPGVKGNEALLRAREQAKEEGINATVYCHPIGYHTHAAGPVVGHFGNQAPCAQGEFAYLKDTAHALELNARVNIPEWDGEELMCCLEGEVYVGEEETFFIYKQPDHYHLIG